MRRRNGDFRGSPGRLHCLTDQPTFVPVTVVLETEWVLRSAYGYKPAEIARAHRAFGGLSGVTIEDAGIVSAAFDLAEQGMDFANALHLGRSDKADGFLTFGRRFVQAAKVAGIHTVREA